MRVLVVRWCVVAAVGLGLGALGAKDKKQPPAAPAKASPKKDDRKGPAPLDGREVPKADELEREAVADQKRDEQVDSLKKIIPKIDDANPQKAEMLFHLAELYWEKSRFLYRKEMLTFFTAQKTVDEQRAAGQKAEEPKEEHRASERFRAETIRLYELVLRDYPAYERKDEVLFNLAYNEYEAGQREVAVARYEELLKVAPGSRFVADAEVQLGNHYFEVANVLDKARGHYERAFASANPRIKSYALYKLAWCDFNAGQHEQALKKLKETVEFSEAQGKEKTFVDLRNEALNDMVRVFVELNRADDAIDYFRAHATKKRVVGLTAKLGEALQSAGHHENAVRTFRALLTDAPLAEAAPEYQQAIVRSYEALRQRERVREEIKKLAELYRPGSEWWAANSAHKEVLRSGFNVAEDAMRSTVNEYHAEAQKTKQVETYRLARDIYKQYLDAFASSEDPAFVADQAFNQAFYYAEILWTLEDWEAAAKAYDRVARFKVPDRPEAKEAANEKYRQQAAYDAILAYDKLVKIERGLLARTELRAGQKVEESKKKGNLERTTRPTKRSAKELEEQPLTATEQALLAACDTYGASFPKSPEAVDVDYMAAVIAYDRNHFVEAARRFGEIILKHPDESRSQQAADLSMAVLEEKEEWLELNTLAKQFKGNAKLARPGSEFARRVASIVENSQYKYVDEVVYRKEKNPKKALGAFLAFAREYPKSELADRALTYAMIIAVDASELDTAIALGERVLKEHPGSPYELQVKYRLAKLAEQTASFGRAAALSDDFVASYDAALAAQKGKAGRRGHDDARRAEWDTSLAECTQPKDNWVQNAAYNAGVWYEGVGQVDKALAAYGRFLARFKDDQDAPRVALAVASALEKQGKLVEATKAYEAYLSASAKDQRVSEVARLEARYRELLLAVRAAKPAEVERLAKELVANTARLKDEDRRVERVGLITAHARFALLEPAYRAYVELKFKRLASFKGDLALKQKRLGELSAQYTEVLKLGNPDFGIAALTRIGQLYADFAKAIQDLPDPPSLNDDELGYFRSELESRYVYPVEEKATDAFEKALGKAYELAVYSEWTQAAQDGLNRYKPGAYPKAHEVGWRQSESFVTAGPVAVDDLPGSAGSTVSAGVK